MILSGRTIREQLDSGRLVIRPLGTGQIQPASVDLRISGETLTIKGSEIVFDEEQEYEMNESDEVVIPAKTHVLVRSLEYMELPNDLAGMTRLRSSLSRVGLMLNNAGWVDPGFKGTLTLSAFNANARPLKIKKGTRFAQLILMRSTGKAKAMRGDTRGRKQSRGSVRMQI